MRVSKSGSMLSFLRSFSIFSSGDPRFLQRCVVQRRLGQCVRGHSVRLSVWQGMLCLFGGAALHLWRYLAKITSEYTCSGRSQHCVLARLSVSSTQNHSKEVHWESYCRTVSVLFSTPPKSASGKLWRHGLRCRFREFFLGIHRCTCHIWTFQGAFTTGNMAYTDPSFRNLQRNTF